MNWTNIISELIEAGLTQVEIASACETTQSNISDLLNGKRKKPNWELGDALLKLHGLQCKSSKQAAA